MQSHFRAGSPLIAERSRCGLALLAAAALLLCAFAPGASAGEAASGVFAKLLDYNTGKTALHPPEHLDSLLAAEGGLPTAERVGRWARRFLADAESEYLFGLKEGGYVADGRLVSDHRQDCVSLVYRSSELARAVDHGDAISLALALRFPGAPLDSLIDESGRVDYDRPEHLDYSLDMLRSGLWGHDLTRMLPGARTDSLGTSRYPAGSYHFLPSAELGQASELLNEGDIAWLVLSGAQDSARRLRDEYGLVIGHIGILVIEAGEPHLIHAASSDLEGVYKGGRVVSVPLSVYLERVDRWQGIIVTRF